MKHKIFLFLCLYVLIRCDNASENSYYDHKKYAVKQEQLTKLDNLKKTPETVFFDYDGTIADESLNDEALEITIKFYFEDEEIKKILKPENKINYFGYLYKNYDLSTVRDISTLYGNQCTNQKIVLLDNIEDLLSYMKSKNIKMNVLTQRAGRNTRKLLKIEKLNNYFDNVFGSYDCGNYTKPSSGFIRCVKKQVKYKSQKDKCLMIGDRITDVKTGQALGCNTAIVSNYDYDRIMKKYKNQVGKSIFFTSYKILLDHFKTIK